MSIIGSGLRTQDELCIKIISSALRTGDPRLRHSGYEEMLTTQSVHWLFEGKRKVINSIISKKFIPSKNSHILEIRSGTGANLSVRSQYVNVTAMEPDDYARETIRGNLCAEPKFIPAVSFPFGGTVAEDKHKA